MKVTQAELLSLNKALQLETTSLATAKASKLAVTDDDLRSLIESGIVTAEARVKGIQQFIYDNALVEGKVE